METPLYTDAEEGYRNTPLVSPVPPPSVFTVPRPLARPRQGRHGPETHPYPAGGMSGRGSRDGPPGHSPYAGQKRDTVAAQGPPAEEVVGTARDVAVLKSDTANPVLLEQQVPRWAQTCILKTDGGGNHDQTVATLADRFADPDLIDMVTALETKLGRSTAPDQVAAGRWLENPAVGPNARARSVFNSSGGGSRALELAALDYLFHVSTYNAPIDATFYFIDLYPADAGTASDYLLWRKHSGRQRVYGWAASPPDYPALAPAKFYSRPIVKDGFHVFRDQQSALLPNDLETLASEVAARTSNHGAHLVLGNMLGPHLSTAPSDGSHVNEAVLNQLIIMFRTLRQGGQALFTVGHLATPLAVSVLYLLHQYFEETLLTRPVPPCDPWAAKRYLLCRGLRVYQPALFEFLEGAVAYMFQCMDEGGAEFDSDRLCLVDPVVMLADEPFTTWLETVNGKHIMAQLKSLQRISKHAAGEEPIVPALDPNLIANRCLQIWQVPLARPVDAGRPRGGSGGDHSSHNRPAPSASHSGSGGGGGRAGGGGGLLDNLLSGISRK
ncbi:hypothetical protein IWQ60_007640 [Tieghemiomyces parasiticus]|uniref:Cap-specific mRNA (nucleoside-2'-O-)-methyltransferase 1 n=1 Tax=Tieghemiomyces parasiticus TaxID=78921 RepID=A0A9W7ZWA6_9FUNG|nr:hypothetical protein IWQ60_007640 [Tieghemiomyces parasiticus]